MMEATGFLNVGESTAAMAYVKARRGVSPRQMKCLLVLCMLTVAMPVGAWASGSWLTSIISIEAAFLGVGLGVLLIQMLSGPSMRRALAKRGQAYEQALTVGLTPEKIVYDLGELTMTAHWSCVTNLYRTWKYWVFLVQSSAMVLPRSIFATPTSEHDFISEAMSRMTESARARSPDAARIEAVSTTFSSAPVHRI